MEPTIVYEGFENGFGEEYPAALTLKGKRIPLQRETRFIRYYPIPEPRLPREGELLEILRFVDGSASLTLSQLENEWGSWTEDDRIDLCRSLHELELLEQPDLHEMIRFILHRGNHRELCCVASAFPHILSPGEAFGLLLPILRNSPIGEASNIVQGIAMTKHPDAAPAIRAKLESTLSQTGLWDDAKFINPIAYDALTCIQYLIILGSGPREFAPLAVKLAQHPCQRVRQKTVGLFSKYGMSLSAAGAEEDRH